MIYCRFKAFILLLILGSAVLKILSYCVTSHSWNLEGRGALYLLTLLLDKHSHLYFCLFVLDHKCESVSKKSIFPITNND